MLMKHILFFTVTLSCFLALLSTQPQEPEKQKSLQQPSPGQLLVTSNPGGLEVYIEHEKQPPKTNLSRFGIVEAKLAGKTPLILDLSPGDYTVAVVRSFNPGEADIPKAPRGCINNFSFSGSTVFWGCYKCNFYPESDKQFRDDIDPYKRDGNIGVCFYATDKTDSAIRYYRLYAIQKGAEAIKLEAKFEK